MIVMIRNIYGLINWFKGFILKLFSHRNEDFWSKLRFFFVIFDLNTNVFEKCLDLNNDTNFLDLI